MGFINNIVQKYQDYQKYAGFVAALNKATGGDMSVKQVKKLTLQLHERTRYLSRQSILGWRQAHQMALDIENPRRDRLYDIYDDVMLDLHLTAVIGQRLLGIISSNFALVDNEGNEDAEATKLLKRTWFRHFLKFAFESKLYGHSLIQFDELKFNPKSGQIEFHKVELFPRRHVRPEFCEVLQNIYDLKGHKYTDGQFSNWVLAIGDESATSEKDLGLLLKIAPQALAKKNQFQFWDEFSELFGMPIRIGKTTSSKQEDINSIESWLQKIGSSGYGVFPEGTEIELKETAKTDAFNVYDKRIDRANSEMSKAILGQTMTTDDGSSRSQSEVHERVAGIFTAADKLDMASWVNDKLIPFLEMHGYGIGDLTFKWENKAMSLTEQMDIDKFILENFQVDDAYFETLSERYNVPIIGLKSFLKVEETPEKTDDEPTPGSKKKDDIEVKTASLEAVLNDLYFSHSCGHNHFVAELSDDENKALKATFDKVTKAMHEGNLTADKLPIDLYFDLATSLLKGVTDNFDNPDYDTPNNVMLTKLRENVFAFSGAKSYSELKQMRDLLLDEKGKIKSFSDYKNDVSKVHQDYNERYLKAEYNTAIASSQMAAKWQDFEKSADVYPNLRYRTVGDSRVRKDHKRLDGIVRPINDDFWNTYFPPNDHGCRCNIEQTDARITSDSKIDNLPNDMIKSPVFKNNVGKTGIIYKDNHPYFSDVNGKVSELEAVKNYGLRTINRIYSDSKNLTKSAPETNFKDWFKTVSNGAKTAVLKDAFGTHIGIDKTLETVLETAAKKAVSNIAGVLSGADEVYSAGGKMVYLRFDLDNVLVSIVDTNRAKVILSDFKIVTISEADKYRKGVLIFKK